MSRITDPLSSAAGHTTESNLPGHVCPFCGLTREVTDHFDPASPCPRCTLPDTASTRNATRLRVGPWFVRQVRNPWAPGMRFETLLALIKRGQVTKDSIVRGPTTQQLWKRAADIKGLSREFGLCHSCGTEISTQATSCPQCNRLQEPPGNPDALLEVRDFAAAVAPTAPVAPKEQHRPATVADEPPAFEMASSPVVDPDDLMAVTEDQTALAREITSRPPVKQKTPPRARQEGVEDALLTPQELAAAFQLDFTPPSKPRAGKKRKATVLAILALGALAFFYFSPDAREKTGSWGGRTVESVKGFITSRTAPASAVPVMPKLPKTSPIEIEPADASDPVPAAVAEAMPKQLETPVAPKPEPDRVGLSRPEPTRAEPQVAKETVKEDVATAPSPAVAPVMPPVPPPVEPAPVVPAPVVEAPKAVEPAKVVDTRPPYDQAKDLWRRAIDAEANQDFVEAVNCYEQIKKLPADVQPWGLEVRLDQARKLTK